MSFGFSLSDIVVSYQLAREIYDRCFTKSQAAGEMTQPAASLSTSTPLFLFHAKLLTNLRYVIYP